MQEPQSQSTMTSTRVARVLGIDVRVHVSVAVIFMLIVSSLALNVFPQWHPQWTAWLNWSTAFTAGVLFFVSLLIHELSHSVVAQRCGIGISAITLFLFGGVAEMQGEPETPKDEFLIAGAGPLASLILALLFGLLASVSLSREDLLLQEALDLSQLSAFTTICVWLASINLMLALFNLLPGFPMDGGRLFRAVLWWRSGNLLQATQLASRVGSACGWLFIGLGALQLLGGNPVNGLWMILIGWFIRRLALSSVASLMLDQALRGFNVRAIMRTRFDTVPADISARRFIEDYLLRSTQQLWPVVDAQGHNLGFVTAQSFDLQGASLENAIHSINRHLQPLDDEHSIDPDMQARLAFDKLANHPSPLPVVEGDNVIGIIHQNDILRWFSFHKLAV